MKQNEFFDLMDGVSEEYIAEMMDRRQTQPISPEKEITIMKQSENRSEKGIRMNRRTVAAGTAVAAALLALNVGGILFLHRSAENLQADTGSESGQDVTSDIIEEVTTDMPAETEPEEAPLPAYAEYMRQYYEGISPESCDYDYTNFIGLGTDLDETWEDENYKVTLKAAVGCDWMIYYFYDVERKNEEDRKYGFSPAVILTTEEDYPATGEEEPAYTIDIIPGTEDDGSGTLSHYYGVISNTTDQPFFHENGQPVSRNFRFFTWDFSEDHCSRCAKDIAAYTLDFSAKAYPLTALEQPQSWTDLARRPSDMLEVLTSYGHDAAFISTRMAETPFGLYYVSEPYQSADWNTIEHTLSAGSGLEGNDAVQKDADGNPIRTFKTIGDTLYGVNMRGDYGLGFLCAIFGQPLDPEQGSAALIFGEQEPWPDWWESGVNEDGLSYGQAYEMIFENKEYDLVFIEGDNGNAGYAYASDLAGTECLAPKDFNRIRPLEAEAAEEEPILPEDAETVTVNVYRRDGKTLIDTATVRKIS